METKNNAVGWFEIPVSGMDRAKTFYEKVLGLTLSRNRMGPLDMSSFSGTHDGNGANGALVYHQDFYKPSQDGTLVYFNAPSGDLANELARIEPEGGKIIQPKKLIAPGVGYMALFTDTEGNRVALHSMK